MNAKDKDENRMIQAVVFDMDGLLVDSEPLWQRARIEAFGADRLRWTEADQERVMGSSTRAWAEYLAEKLDHAFTVEQIIDKVVSQMEAYYREHVPILPGASEALERLNGRYPLGLASGAPYRLIDAVLGTTGWASKFGHVLSADDMPRGKPAPDIYLEIMARMGVEPARTVVFEDSGNGILSGHAAGVKVIAVPGAHHRPAEHVLAKADRVLESLSVFTPEMLDEL